MPTKSPGYNVPPIPPTGNPDVDNALSQWVNEFGLSYKQGQEESERLPFVVTTYTTDGSGNPVSNYLSKKVQLNGGEQVIVTGTYDFSLTAGVLHTTDGQSESRTCGGKLKITYPGGTETTFNPGQQARHRLTVQGNRGSSNDGVTRTTVTVAGTHGYTWPVEARFQTGGEHVFTLYTTGDGSVTGAQITIQVS